MRVRTKLIAILTLALLVPAVVAAQDGTTTRIDGQPTELESVTIIQYGDSVYEVSAADGPVVAFVDAVIETEAGVALVGTVLIHDKTGWRVSGVFYDPAPSEYAEAIPDDVLTLALPDRLGATE